MNVSPHISARIRQVQPDDLAIYQGFDLDHFVQMTKQESSYSARAGQAPRLCQLGLLVLLGWLHLAIANFITRHDVASRDRGEINRMRWMLAKSNR